MKSYQSRLRYFDKLWEWLSFNKQYSNICYEITDSILYNTLFFQLLSGIKKPAQIMREIDKIINNMDSEIIKEFNIYYEIIKNEECAWEV